MFQSRKSIEKRLRKLEKHLKQENPVLIDAVKSFRELDGIAWRMGLIGADESYATQIPWWPLISVLGTFSAGKSTFINSYLGIKLQTSGNQAVDDKFTVICYSSDQKPRVLPGLALNADPRFPFYRISEEIEKVAPGEGERVNAYLQLKTCPSETIKGKILIDSPGFDADAQRTSTLRITDHIIDLSDLVLVFFDARHPEPGAMKDTLDHLVTKTITRTDSSKFLYILNQIDTAAKEDNPEEVVGAWQRALSQAGLTAGKFYMIYDEQSAIAINDQKLQERFKTKKDADLEAIYQRMNEVRVERAYRIIGALEKTASALETRAVPALRDAMRRWTRRVLVTDGVLYAALLGLAAYGINAYDAWGKLAPAALIEAYKANPLGGIAVAVGVFALFYGVHLFSRRFWARRIERSLPRSDMPGDLVSAFRRNTRVWRSVFHTTPKGWSRRVARRVNRVIEDSALFVQKLNDSFTNPSGSREPSPFLEQDAAPAAASEQESVAAAETVEAAGPTRG